MTELEGRWQGVTVLLRVRDDYVAGTPEELIELAEEAIARHELVEVTPTGPTLRLEHGDALAIAAWLSEHEGVAWGDVATEELLADQRLAVPEGAQA